MYLQVQTYYENIVQDDENIVQADDIEQDDAEKIQSTEFQSTVDESTGLRGTAEQGTAAMNIDEVGTFYKEF